MRARISILGSDSFLHVDGDEPGSATRLPLTEDTLTRFKEWTLRYRRSVRLDDPDALAAIGTELFEGFDAAKGLTRWRQGTGERLLEVAVDHAGTEAASALLDLPWEVLAQGGDFLAADPTQPFLVFRSLGRAPNARPATPAHRDVALMFMAAAPKGQRELDFEAEEAAILQATARLPLQVVVEESGCGAFLKDRLAQEGPFDVVHLSCHGDILPSGEPALALETPEGELALTGPGDVAAILGEGKASLVFLSACRTAEVEAELGESFVRALVRAGVANAVGWDGSVFDSDAIAFAQTLYGELAEHASLPYAAARARRECLRLHRDDPRQGRHWHLARVYAGPAGAGPLCDRTRPKRQLRKEAGFKEFLDKANRRVPVAGAREFVGRRRPTREVLSAFRANRTAGVLIVGMGHLGKSSLAARIANRLPTHQTVVVYERYDALAIFDQLVAALPGSERARWVQLWRPPIAEHGAGLADALEELLEGPLDAKPILLIIDDLEQILEPPTPSQAATPVREAPGAPDAWRVSLAAVLRAFQAADTESRLLLTSRFAFTLPDGAGGDLADRLTLVPLPSMDPREQAKQWRAAARSAGRALPAPGEGEREWVRRAQAAAGGNPGLQEILCRPILAGEPEAARAAITAIERWRASGDVPAEGNAAQEFFQRVCFETYRDALSESQRAQLRATTLFSEGLPVPVAALEAVGRATGAADPSAAVARLLGLGLVDGWGLRHGIAHAAANPLARPLLPERLTEEEQRDLATVAVAPLAAAWREAAGDFPVALEAVEVARLALLGEVPAEVLQPAALAAGAFLFHSQHDARAALAILGPALARIEDQGGLPQPRLLLLASNCAERIGETQLQIALLEQGLSLREGDTVELAQMAVQHAVATIGRDGPENALETLRNAATLFEEAGDGRSRAVTLGKIADVLVQRGETEEALRIRREEQLPVYERLGDVRSRAVTLGKIADVLVQRGETEEALRIRREEQLPVFERLGDVRARAVTLGQIADVLVQRGETEEALRIHLEDRLPVALKMKDMDSIAHIRFSCAQLRLRRGGLEQGDVETILGELLESFQLYMQLQRADGVAFAGLLLGQLLAAVNHVDEALTILDLSAAAFERLTLDDNVQQVRDMQRRLRERQG